MRQNFHKFFVSLLLLTSCGIKSLPEKLVSGNDKVRAAAVKKLISLPSEKQATLVEPLLAYLTDPESRIANRAVESLIIIGKPAIEGLSKKFHDADVYVRISAVGALGQMGPQAPEAIPDLTLLLKDPHPLVREEAIFALGQIGPAAASAGPALLELFRSSNKEQQELIAEALKKIGISPPNKRRARLPTGGQASPPIS